MTGEAGDTEIFQAQPKEWLADEQIGEGTDDETMLEEPDDQLVLANFREARRPSSDRQGILSRSEPQCRKRGQQELRWRKEWRKRW